MGGEVELTERKVEDDQGDESYIPATHVNGSRRVAVRARTG